MNFQLHHQLTQDCITLGDLPLCRVLLMNDRQFPWLILVPRRQNIQEIYQLSPTDQTQYHIESITISKLLMSHYNGDKLNIAALGNVVPQLHIHHIVRFHHDAVWPKPVWGNISPTPYTENELSATCEQFRGLLHNDLRQEKVAI